MKYDIIKEIMASHGYTVVPESLHRYYTTFKFIAHSGGKCFSQFTLRVFHDDWELECEPLYTYLHVMAYMDDIRMRKTATTFLNWFEGCIQ